MQSIIKDGAHPEAALGSPANDNKLFFFSISRWALLTKQTYKQKQKGKKIPL